MLFRSDQRRKATGDGIGVFSIRVRHLEKDTVEMIFPFFPFLFWRFWVCEGNTLMRYCRNDFSLFFPFSVFPSKSFFFIFFILFSVVCHRIIRRKKKTKNYFFGGKREKGKNYKSGDMFSICYFTQWFTQNFLHICFPL